MGNKSSARAEAMYVEDDSISKIEHESLRNIFGASVSNDDFEIKQEMFCVIFSSSIYPLYGRNLFSSIKSANDDAMKFSEFYKFAILACKTSVSSCTKCLLSAFKVPHGIELQANDLVSYDVQSFLNFCCEIGNIKLSENSIKLIGRKLFHHFQSKVIKSNSLTSGSVPNMDTVNGYDYATLSNWMNEYFPCISQLLFTYVNLICFRETILSPSSSFHLFRSPNLISESETYVDNRILKYGEEFLLSLQSDKLQGSWKLLYNSNVHGRSFNRIAHHLLGYEVRNID